MAIDWFAVLLLGAAYVFSTVKSVRLSIRLAAFSIACFTIAGFRVFRGAAGLNLLFVGVTVFLGARYAYDAVKALRAGS